MHMLHQWKARFENWKKLDLNLGVIGYLFEDTSFAPVIA
jgi:hypothetical protein